MTGRDVCEGNMKSKQLAVLTVEEEKAWEHAFFFYVVDEGKTDAMADKMAWRDLQKEFPRLKEFRGISQKSPES